MSEGGVALVRPMRADDVESADLVTRLAFGTHWGLSEPESAFGDAEFVRSRFIVNPTGAFIAERDDEIIGAALVTHWGSSGFFGPLAVRPDLWGQGVARHLLEPATALLDHWGVAVAGLFTFPDSPRHVTLYQRHGFFTQNLTALLSRRAPRRHRRTVVRFSSLSAADRLEFLVRARALTDSIYPGLDVSTEIEAVDALDLGDTVILERADRLVGIAICHCGAGEAGSQGCYVKFAGVAPSPRAARDLGELMGAVEAFAAESGVAGIVAGVAMSRREAFRCLSERGYQTVVLGVRMHRPDVLGYCGADDFVLDDLR